MRQLNQTEVKAVSGAGLLTSTLGTTIAAGSAIGGGLLSGGAILLAPLATGALNLLKFIV